MSRSFWGPEGAPPQGVQFLNLEFVAHHLRLLVMLMIVLG
jgi:hypothetical protein